MNDKTPMSREEEMLKSIARQVDASPSFKYELEKKLMNAHKPAKPGLFSVKKIVFSAGWAVGLATLALTFISVIHSIAPQPLPAADGTPVPALETATPQPQDLPEGKIYKTSNQDFVMTLDFPEPVPQFTLYELKFPARDNPDYESEALRDLAAKIGIDGGLYYLEDHNSAPGFFFTDGKQRLMVNDIAPYQYTYYADFTRNYYQSPQQNTMSIEEMTANAEEFLKPRGLLDFPYQVASSSDPVSRMLTFEPRLDDIAYTFENLTTLQVSFDSNGEIFTINLDIHPCEPVGVYPLISAEQAWDRFIASEFKGLGAEMHAYGYNPTSFRRWERETPLDQLTYIISTVESFQPVEGDTPLLIAGAISLTGNLEGLTDAQGTLQLNGQYVMDGEAKKFQVDDWAVSEPPAMRDGTLEQVDGQTWLVTTSGERLLLENVPTDLTFGEMTYVNGMLSGDKFDWITIDQGQGGGGGGGGGGGAGLARVNLSGTPMPTATPWAVSTPANYASLIGSRLEGERGDLYGWNLEAEDGSTHFAYQITSNTEEGFLDTFWTANLEGPGTKGMEAYFYQPVRIWGTITSASSQGIMTIQVDRYEAVYPDSKVQLWIGEEKVTEVNGQNVMLFTAEDGTSYVREDSIDYLGEPTVAEPGLVYYITGWVNPEKTFGEYPVLQVRGMGTISPDSDFDAILAGTLLPPTMPESRLNVSGEIPTGVVTHIELVYQNEDQIVYEPEEGRVLYAQPFWRFSGYDGEYSYFDIIVQALPDEYLQPVPLQ